MWPEEATALPHAAPALLEWQVKKMMDEIKLEIDEIEEPSPESFRTLDMDRDGVISREEMERAMHALKPESRPDPDQFLELLV